MELLNPTIKNILVLSSSFYLIDSFKIERFLAIIFARFKCETLCNLRPRDLSIRVREQYLGAITIALI